MAAFPTQSSSRSQLARMAAFPKQSSRLARNAAFPTQSSSLSQLARNAALPKQSSRLASNAALPKQSSRLASNAAFPKQSSRLARNPHFPQNSYSPPALDCPSLRGQRLCKNYLVPQQVVRSSYLAPHCLHQWYRDKLLHVGGQVVYNQSNSCHLIHTGNHFEAMHHQSLLHRPCHDGSTDASQRCVEYGQRILAQIRSQTSLNQQTPKQTSFVVVCLTSFTAHTKVRKTFRKVPANAYFFKSTVF